MLWKWHRVAKAERGITGEVADLDGTWKLTSWTMSGWATPDWAIRGFTLNFEAGRYTREVLSERKGTLRLHPSASPPQVDLLRDSPVSKGIRDLSKGTNDYFGIYRLEDDTLTLDLGIDRERPKELGPHPNTFQHRVFKRAGGAWRGA